MNPTAANLAPLRLVRRRRLYTQKTLAAAAGVTIRTITEIEAGRSRPRIETIRKICDVLKVDPLEVAEFTAAIEHGRFAERPAQ